jgi:hypothetical protein
MKVLDKTSMNYLLPINNKNNFGQIGNQVQGTLLGFKGDKALIGFGNQTLTMSSSVLIGKEKGSQLTFEVVGSNKEKALRYIEDNQIVEQQSRSWMKLENIRSLSADEFVNILKEMDSKVEEDINFNEEVKKHIEEVITKVTKNDLQKMLDSGYDPQKLSIEMLNKIISRVKETGSYGKENEFKPEIDINGFSHLSENQEQLKQVVKKLEDNNLPTHEKMVSKVLQSLDKLEAVTRVNDASIAYLLRNDLEFTVNNLYKAQHATQNVVPQQNAVDFNGLEQQMIEVIQNAGMEPTSENIEQAKWLIQQDIPLTQESLKLVSDLKDLKNKDWEDKLTLILDALSEGKPLGQLNLKTENQKTGIDENQIQKVQEQVKAIEDRQIQYVIRHKLPLHIQQISEVSGETSIQLNEQENEHYLTAKRQIEEIRLRLTYDSARKLYQKGFRIETESLDQVVEALKESERQYNQSLFQEAGIEPTEEQLNAYEKTNQKVQELKYLPMTLLGRVLKESLPQRLESLHNIGQDEKLTYQKAQTAYDTLMTQPRKDLGDALSKTYDQIQPILEDLGLESTMANERAVKILAHHELPLTLENIMNIKALDGKVNHLIQKIHPAAVLHMIKEGENPLQMPLDELINRVDQIKEELGITQEERFSAYLYDLEKNSELTSEERDGLVGVYRLLHHIDKSEGKALAYLFQQDREVNLKNMLTATRLLRHNAMDLRVDDDFGFLENLQSETKNIQQQLEEAFKIKQTSEEQNEGQAYLIDLLETIKELATPGRLQALQQNESNIISLPIERLYELLMDLEISNETQSLEEKTNQLNEQIQQLNNIQKATLEFMEEFQVPFTVKNVLTTQMLMQDNFLLQKSIGSLKNQLEEPEKEKIEQALSHLFDQTNDDQVRESIEELKEIIHRIYKEEVVQKPLAQLEIFKQIENLLQVQGHLSEEGFYQIPIIIDGQITQMNVQYIKDTENHIQNKSEIRCTLPTETFGQVQGQMVIENGELQVTVTFEKEENKNKFEKHVETLKEALSGMGYDIEKIELEHTEHTTTKLTKIHNGQYDLMI